MPHIHPLNIKERHLRKQQVKIPCLRARTTMLSSSFSGFDLLLFEPRTCYCGEFHLTRMSLEQTRPVLMEEQGFTSQHHASFHPEGIPQCFSVAWNNGKIAFTVWTYLVINYEQHAMTFYTDLLWADWSVTRTMIQLHEYINSAFKS